jgi:hypothetical protein
MDSHHRDFGTLDPKLAACPRQPLGLMLKPEDDPDTRQIFVELNLGDDPHIDTTMPDRIARFDPVALLESDRDPRARGWAP